MGRKCKISDEDLIGMTFGFWTVEKISDKKVGNHTYYFCKCICGKEKEIRKTLLINNKTISCGCKGKHQVKGNRYGRLIALTNGYLKEDNRIYVDVICDCGETNTVLKQSLESGLTQSCGCLNKEILKSHCGENNANYNPNLTDIERNKNNSRGSQEGYQKFRRMVLKRDDNTCVCCGEKQNKDMRVHHLDGWNWCEEKRFDITNAITLCPECHDIQYEGSFHYIYRYGNNTKEQFEKYKEMRINEFNKEDLKVAN